MRAGSGFFGDVASLALLLFGFAPAYAADPSIGDKAAAGVLITQLEIETAAAPGMPVDPVAWRGQPAVLYVWGDWCRACAKSTPEVLTLARQFPALHFVFINTDDPAHALLPGLPDNVIDARVMRQHFGEKAMRKKGFRFADLGLVFAVPAYFVLDRQGRLAAAGNGSRYALQLAAELSAVAAPR